jgi:hypothetical protein
MAKVSLHGWAKANGDTNGRNYLERQCFVKEKLMLSKRSTTATGEA